MCDSTLFDAAINSLNDVWARLRTLVALVRGGDHQVLTIIEGLLERTIPTTATDRALATVMQILAAGDSRQSTISYLFKERRACLLLLVEGAAAVAIQADDILTITQAGGKYTVALRGAAPRSTAVHMPPRGATMNLSRGGRGMPRSDRPPRGDRPSRGRGPRSDRQPQSEFRPRAPRTAHPDVMGLDAMNEILAGAAEVLDRDPLPETGASYIKALLSAPAAATAATAATAAAATTATATTATTATAITPAEASKMSWAEMDEQNIPLDFGMPSPSLAPVPPAAPPAAPRRGGRTKK